MKNLSITKSEESPGIKHRQKTKQFNSLIQKFTTMKKHALILVLAFFASTVIVFGQAVPFTPPQPLVNCSDGPLTPIAGKSYNYAAIANPAGGDFLWWATQNEQFITTVGGVTTYNNVAPDLLTVANGDLMATSANYNVADPQNSVDITWSSSTLGNVNPPSDPLFVALRYTTVPGCTDNFKVYEILPINGFTVDVLALDPITHLPVGADPYAYEPAQCPDTVRGASWANSVMTYNYGTDTLFFEFVAANFTDYWVPTFALSGQNGAQGLVYEYTYDLPNTWGVATVWNPIVSGTTQIQTNEISTSGGISVFVRVTVANGTFENLAGQLLTMTLDGQNAEGSWDVVNATCTDPGAADGDDTSLQTISARPTLTPTSGAWE